MNEYSFIILKEGQPITADLLKEKLPPDTPIDELVTYLKQNKVCKKKDGECLYVGVVEWRQYLLCFFPKYYDVTGIKRRIGLSQKALSLPIINIFRLYYKRSVSIIVKRRIISRFVSLALKRGRIWMLNGAVRENW